MTFFKESREPDVVCFHDTLLFYDKDGSIACVSMKGNDAPLVAVERWIMEDHLNEQDDKDDKDGVGGLRKVVRDAFSLFDIFSREFMRWVDKK